MIVKLLRPGHRFYKQAISPLLGNCCRFDPPCSDFALQAIEKHGVLAGLGLACLRVLRCNSLFEGGFDPVPDKLCLWKKKHNDNCEHGR